MRGPIRVIFLIALAYSGHVSAANILWNYLANQGNGRIGCYEPNGIPIWPDMTFSVIERPQTVMLVPTNEFVLEFIGVWAVAVSGELVDGSIDQNLERCFIRSEYGGSTPVHIGTPVEIRKNDSVYMALSVGEIDFLQDPAVVSRYLYGWVEIIAADDGTVSVGYSAIDLDGGPMIVGGGSALIPEPSSALLLLVGGALLALRRSRNVRFDLSTYPNSSISADRSHAMKFFLSSLLSCLFAVLGYTAQIEWDTITVRYNGPGSSGRYPDTIFPETMCFESPHVLLAMTMAVIPHDVGVEVKSITYSLYMEYANAFVGANPGDVVNDTYIDTAPKRFSYARYSDYNYGEDRHADYSIILKDDESAFLAFRNESPLFSGTTFGWIELGLGDDGKVQVLRSAWDRDGDPITVGATPEPSSAILLLVGSALLALRRRALV